MTAKRSEKKAARALQATTGWSYQTCIHHLRNLKNKTKVAGEKSESAAKVRTEDTCSHCGAALDDESVELRRRFGALSCPECSREGCHLCMPAGRDCICPECEAVR